MASPDNPGAFGALLLRHRVAAGLTQDELAERAGLSRRGISDLERGARRTPYPATVRRLLDALQLGDEERRVLRAAALPASRPDTHPSRRLHNLSRALSTPIGREDDVRQVVELVERSPLVTLTGAGGVGKTRLALAVADSLLDAFPDGVWLVELASLTDAALVTRAVASSVGIQEAPDQTILGSLVYWLEPREALLVLDNCEHLVEASAALAEAVLAACPNLRLLATSREPLRIPGEATWRVPSLAAPDPRRPHSAEEVAGYPAVQLFMQRARAVRPEFAIEPHNASAVARICARVEGIPLALELAAARVRVLGPEQIMTRLDDAFGLLTDGSRTATRRQQTLRATLDWGHDLLAARERVLFRRLGVFVDGFDLEAAEVVCVELSTSEVLDSLTRLVDTSLVQMDERSGAARYRLLELLRQYSLDRLTVAGEVDATRRRHADWCIRLAERAEPELWGPDQQVWLEKLEAEHGNLRSALDWCATRDPHAGLRVAACLSLFWQVRGYLEEGRRWLEALLDAAPEPTVVRARALHAAGQLARHQADIASAIVLCDESLAIYRDLGETKSCSAVLRSLGLLAWDGGDPRRGSAFFEESLAECRASGDRLELATTLGTAGCLALVDADHVRARTCLEESLALYQELPDTRSIAVVLGNLGHLALDEGDDAVATKLLDEKLAVSRAIGNKRDVAYALGWLGNIARHQGDSNRARQLVSESLALHREIGDRLGIAYCVCFCGVLAVHDGDHASGMRLISAASSLHAPLEFQLTPRERADRDAALERARTTDGDAAFVEASSEGRAMTLQQAIESALSVASATAPRSFA